MSVGKSIFVNQIGYAKNKTKFAYVRKNDVSSSSFLIKDSNGQIVYTGELSAEKTDRLAGEPICVANFSDFTQEGSFTLWVDDKSSFEFPIGDDVYNHLYYLTNRYFYLSRCGQKIVDDDFGHEPCHTSKALIYGTNEYIDVQGGWHDAGDYGRYIVAGAKTVMDLLLAYQESKDSYKDFDILDEVRFELEWMLQMQRPDGGVYHKISCWHFCGFIMPEEEKDEIVLAPVSTSATADFAGSLAFASKFYKDSDREFAQKLLDAALKAQEYLDCHEDELYTNPAGITTGGYGDKDVSDERYFALCALYAATKNETFYQKAMNIRKNHPQWTEAFSWACVSAYGTEILIKETDAEAKDELKNSILQTADKVLEIVNNASFGTSLIKAYWGCNGGVCDYAHILLLAHDFTGKAEYYEAAKKQLDYLLGCNPLSVCYVTGIGKNPTQKPHHRPSGFLQKTMPGMLAGGPSEWAADEVTKKIIDGKAPLACYADAYESFCTNEIAIYWNSPLVYTIAKLKLV